MFAVITGATGGLGRAFAQQLAGRGYDLLLTARNNTALKELAREIKAGCPVAVEVLAADLARPEGAEQLLAACEGRPVEVFINNAGFGLLGPSSSLPWEKEAELLAVNVSAAHRLAKTLLSRMDRGYILNVGSLAGFQPAPGMAAYAASKAWLVQWSRAVGYELRRQGKPITLSVLCPGPVKTGFDQAAGARRKRGGMDPDRCVRIALRGLLRGKAQIVPGLSMKLLVLASRLLPTGLMLPAQYRLQSRKLKK